jgi:electron transfer flavoprotein beta subunit
VIKDLNKPRYPSVGGIVEAYREREVKIWTAGDIDADITKIGLEGSPTQVKRTFAPEPKGEGEIISGTGEEAAKTLLQKLRNKNVIR